VLSPDPVARGSAMLFWARAAASAGIFTAVLILARSLGPTGRGTIAFITVSALLIGRLAGFGMGEATTVFAARRTESRATLLSNLILFVAASALAVGALGYAVLLALAGERPAGVGRPELAILVAAGVAIALIEASGSFLIGCGRLHRLALITATVSWVYPLLLGLAWLLDGLTVTRAALVWVVSEAIIVTVLLAESARGIGFARPSPTLLAESFHFGLRAWVGSMARLLNFRTDQVLLGLLASEAALGIYAVAVNVSEVLLYLPAATATALLPVAARTGGELRAEQALRAFRGSALVTACAALVAAVLGPVLLPVLFGPAFEGSVTPFLLLLPGALGFAAIAVFSNALLGASSPGFSSFGPLVALVLGVALDIVLIPRYGASGAAAAATVAFLAGGCAAMLAFRRGNPFPWRTLLHPQREDLSLFRALARPLGFARSTS
jgi:O-antigen/teichoic acid export membrane protein